MTAEEDRRAKLERLAAYLLEDGCDVPSIVARLDRLKFDRIMAGEAGDEAGLTEPQPAGPILTEQRTDHTGRTYTCEWHCQPPQPGITYRVTDCTWTPDRKTRRIYRIELGQGRDQR